ncbi:MAG: hypothetical protein GF329_03670, partial [Candidatus Lokiarchaeota archaeon]|nr:hypothetical protein [Candidatus Lokiarchaeota archaeon]
MKKFVCMRCGDCCCPKKEPNNIRYIPIYLDELDIILQKAQDYRTNMKIRPDLVYVDVLNDRLIIATYEMIIKDKCEFYSDNIGCKIYDERPITCKAFPIMMWRPDGHRKYLFMNPKCTYIARNSEVYNLGFSKLARFFHDEYRSAKRLMNKRSEMLNKILQLESDKIIDIGFLR